MILDERNEFADAVSVAAAAGTALIGDVIDLGSIARDIGAPEHLFFTITVDTEIITGGSAGTIEFLLVSDAQAAIATDGSATVHWRSGTFVTDDAAANATLMNAGSILAQIALPLQGAVYERYLGVLCIIATTTVTAGAISAFLTPDKHTNSAKHYAEGVN
jgi:hypothetical protein